MENTTVYETPALVEIGDFTELTLCTPWGSCRDFLGCGSAPVCVG
ncbi:lasso RiPP family leader peptide-containing protein [Kitasatospora sp. NPDC097691]